MIHRKKYTREGLTNYPYIYNKKMTRFFLFTGLLILTGCNMHKTDVDLLIRDAKIYTVDRNFSVAEAVAIKEGHIVETGTAELLEGKYRAKSVVSLPGHFIYPGFFDAHCHFTGYGLSLNQVDLAGTSSVEEILEACRVFNEKHNPAWITGRGWDQNDWETERYPNR